MKRRVATALVGAPLIAAAIWFGNPWYPLLIAMIAMLACYEFFRMSQSRAAPLTYWGIFGALLLTLSTLYPGSTRAVSPPLLVMAAIVVVSLSWLVLRSRREQAVHDWAWTLAGILYTGFLLSFLMALRGREHGLGWTFLAIFTAFAADTSAFFIGKSLGKHKLAPTISPAKTWEGLVAGLVGASIASLLLTAVFDLPLNIGQALAVGLLIGIAATLGDLTESLIKRNLGVKDSERWLPGHGGILDRFDSVIFSGVAVYFYAVGLEMLS
ncbi:MAG: phosphatidate cytidylyltransferase [Dehalococcoidia bacterium]|nr:phosphatidate cytidylyltransferase [Dehalococcoidia bacterium]